MIVREQDAAFGGGGREHGPCLKGSLEVGVEEGGKQKALCGGRRDGGVRMVDGSESGGEVNVGEGSEMVG